MTWEDSLILKKIFLFSKCFVYASHVFVSPVKIVALLRTMECLVLLSLFHFIN